jgi:hypothetical protein
MVGVGESLIALVVDILTDIILKAITRQTVTMAPILPYAYPAS